MCTLSVLVGRKETEMTWMNRKGHPKETVSSGRVNNFKTWGKKSFYFLFKCSLWYISQMRETVDLNSLLLWKRQCVNSWRSQGAPQKSQRTSGSLKAINVSNRPWDNLRPNKGKFWGLSFANNLWNLLVLNLPLMSIGEVWANILYYCLLTSVVNKS